MITYSTWETLYLLSPSRTLRHVAQVQQGLLKLRLKDTKHAKLRLKGGKRPEKRSDTKTQDLVPGPLASRRAEESTLSDDFKAISSQSQSRFISESPLYLDSLTHLDSPPH